MCREGFRLHDYEPGSRGLKPYGEDDLPGGIPVTEGLLNNGEGEAVRGDTAGEGSECKETESGAEGAV